MSSAFRWAACLALTWSACASAQTTADAAPASAPAQATSAQSAPSFWETRHGLDNCRIRFTRDKEGRVAFLGGSITCAAPGWRDFTSELLQKRFPETRFEFVNAGLGGTNSTLGAFRLEDDAFKGAKLDLLIVEFAVNDDGPDAPDNRRARALEGIVRHALRLNPEMDIFVQYFIDQGKVETITKGEVPEVIAAHDAVTAHYGLPALDLAKEMTRRLNAGEFTWSQFSGDSCHPSRFGHEQYLGCISAFLDAIWAKPLAPDAAITPHLLPAPLDPLNYENGRFLPLEAARVLEGWTRIQDWSADKTCNYGGPVDVLAAEKAGATLELPFTGSLVGIYAIAGTDAGVLECAVDGGTPSKIDMFDHYCEVFHRPVCRTLAEGLPAGPHVLRISMADEQNPKSAGHAARILKFVAN